MAKRVLDVEGTGKVIKELRKENGLTVETIAESLSCSSQAVYKWQRGESMPTLDNMIELAKMLDVTLDDLVQTKDMDDVA